MTPIRTFINRLLRRFNLQIIRPHNDISWIDSPKEHDFSHLGEQGIIFSLMRQLGPNENKICVDIAASDGLTMSNTAALFRNGWRGLAVEASAPSFAKLARNYESLEGISLARGVVTPSNVCGMLAAFGIPKVFALLNLDIDSYDFFVLENLLGIYKPQVVVAEVNEKIPPPLKFAVKYDAYHVYKGDHFYGQSICMLDELMRKHDYSLHALHYNNAFYLARGMFNTTDLTPELAYERGYLAQKDRRQKFPWNSNVEAVLGLDKNEAKKFLNDFFSQYKGRYILE